MVISALSNLVVVCEENFSDLLCSLCCHIHLTVHLQSCLCSHITAVLFEYTIQNTCGHVKFTLVAPLWYNKCAKIQLIHLNCYI